MMAVYSYIQTTRNIKILYRTIVEQNIVVAEQVQSSKFEFQILGNFQPDNAL